MTIWGRPSTGNAPGVTLLSPSNDIDAANLNPYLYEESIDTSFLPWWLAVAAM